MKKIAVLLLVGLLLTGYAFADAVDDGLPVNTDSSLKAHTRAMIKAGVDVEEGLLMTRAMLENQYQTQQVIEAQEIVMTSARTGLPTEPVINKAHEGMAKGIQPGRVVQAMTQVQGRYAQAHQMTSQINLGPQAQTRAGNLMAEAMTAGMTETGGTQITQQLQTRTQTMNQSEAGELAVQTAMTARTMARMGVDADTTTAVVCLALQNQFQAQEMAQLRQQFHTQTQEQNPQELAQQFAHSFQNGNTQGPLGSHFGQGGNATSGNGASAGAGGSGNAGGASGSSGAGGGSGGGGSGGSGAGGGSGGGGSGGGGSGGGSGGSGR